MQVHSARLHSYHNAKSQMLGNKAGHAPPAWRTAPVPGIVGGPGKRPAPPPEKGSKILLSNLPPDVGDSEVEMLFTKTVGPVRDTFIVYNSQGHSKGMAVVTFKRSSDAAIARAKYHQKIVDGRRPIKIEIIRDDDDVPQPSKPPSLLERLSLALPPQVHVQAARPFPPAGVVVKQPAYAVKQPAYAVKQPAYAVKQPAQQRKLPARPAANRPVAMNIKARVRQKKGPRRIKKTVAQLDQEMEEYRARAET
ncbi:uncharacterized protein LAESUDRAFT_715547 [Laetiporus sulphureus 93-53]|uniref:RRM domain-containing protein n=1 Tax=Laetiporus sulphureus 93-53 TaxID=1314785 RepID=A0A165DBQ6_9APHY|nr:uncharacterized protein LAESUDRAFT_715547 [Laetiporus sulphureus 93-53]KZT04501.1 hypothetical protein LAESUDRAFT_715547 [Laetiporus sulphureus 93-53]